MLIGSARAATLKCGNVAYRYGKYDGYILEADAYSITASKTNCSTARHLAYDAAHAYQNSTRLPPCVRPAVLHGKWCATPTRLDGFTMHWHHVLSDVNRVAATRGSAVIRFYVHHD